MITKIIKVIILICIGIGVYHGIHLTYEKQEPEIEQKKIDQKIFEVLQTRCAEITEFYTYGRSFNVSGRISNISKDNFESIRLVISDGQEYEKMYKMNTEFKENELFFHSDQEINNTIIIDELKNGEYYIFLRVKLNNSVDPRYYSFKNISDYENITYYTISKDSKNRKVEIAFKQKEYNEKQYPYLSLFLQDAELPDEVYDIVIDAGHGGADRGVKQGADTEANITLEYAKLLKDSLEQNGLKVKLTRNDENTDLYNSTNMYDSAGRITSACKSKAKLMISFHINDGASNLKGLEIYSPSKSNLDFAKNMAEKIKQYSTISYSNYNSYKMLDGVYVKNFTASVIKEFANTANKKGYEPYDINTDTPYLYTIREVGGIATNAYVDGRNEAYSKNVYYNANYGIECYQVELGYIKTDLEIIKNEKENYIRAITEAILEWNKLNES